MQERLRSEIPAAVPEITSLINGISSSKSQVAQSEEEIILAGNPIIEEILGPDRFEISPGSFFQTNTDAAEMLYQTALSMAELTGTEVVYDLYSGTGSIAIFVSRYARHIVGMEYVTESVRDAIRNAERNGIHNCEFHGGDLKDTLRNFSSSPDVVIVDPPRSGLHPDVIESLLEMNTRRIVYVSCNPATQARDLEILCRDRYTLDRLQPVDMFPHTFHIENVAQLTRR